MKESHSPSGELHMLPDTVITERRRLAASTHDQVSTFKNPKTFTATLVVASLLLLIKRPLSKMIKSQSSDRSSASKIHRIPPAYSRYLLGACV